MAEGLSAMAGTEYPGSITEVTGAFETKSFKNM